MNGAWQAAHRPVAGVPRWAVRAVWLIQLSVLPSSLWRILVFTFHVPLWLGEVGNGNLPAWFPIELYVVALSLVSELFAFAAFGLVCRWGEVWPRWVPLLRGRTIRPLVAVVPAVLGAFALTVMWTWTSGLALLGRNVQGEPHHDPGLTWETWQGTTMLLVYLPLLLWGPLLGALTVHYARRRRLLTGPGQRELDRELPGPVGVGVGDVAAEGAGPFREAGEPPAAAATRC
jgi:hypothetical protein